MKTIKLIFAMMISVVTIATSQLDNKPYIVLEAEGDVTVTTLDGETFAAKAGTYLYAGNTINIGEDSHALLNHGVITIPLNEKGSFELDDELEEDLFASLNSIDPLFSDFSSNSIEMVIDAKEYGGWALDTGNKGNAWGPKEKLDPGGWGAKDKLDPGGWGAKDKLDPGGWGANPTQSLSGFGIKEPHVGGWGAKDKLDPGGWGAKDKLDKGGWGAKDKLDKGGWGIKDKNNPGGWGTEDTRAQKSWGAKDKLDPGGWGTKDMTIEPKVPGGFYLGEINEIEWLNELGVSEYLFIVADTSNNLIHSEISTTRKVEFDFSTLEHGKQYFWQVIAEGKKAISAPVHFKVVSPCEYHNSMDTTMKSNIYTDAGIALKGLMRAFAQEENGYYYEALNNFKYLLNKFPDNNLIKVNFTSFCLRMGQYNYAQDIALRI